MKSKKTLAADIYVELKQLERRMKIVLVQRSTNDLVFKKLNKQYWEKKQKYLEFMQKHLVFPDDVEIPGKPCTLCKSKEFWRTGFNTVVCMTCYPPASPSDIQSKVQISYSITKNP